MQRLNGRKMILAFLGRSPRSKYSWRVIRERFGNVIYCDPRTGHAWAMAEDLIAADKARCVSMTEFLKSWGQYGGDMGKHVGGFPREFERIVKRLTGR